MIRLKNILTENRLIKRIRQENPNINFIDDYSIAKTRGSGMIRIGASPSLVYIITMEDVPAQSRDLKTTQFSWTSKHGGPGGEPGMEVKEGIAQIIITPDGKYRITLGPAYVAQVTKYIDDLATDVEAISPAELIKKLSDVRSLNAALRVPPAPALNRQTADITVKDGRIQAIMKPWSAPSGTYQLKQPAIAFALRANVIIANTIKVQSLNLDTGEAVLEVYGKSGKRLKRIATNIRSEVVQTIIDNMFAIYAKCAQKNCVPRNNTFSIEAGEKQTEIVFTPIFYRNNPTVRVSD